MYSKLKVFSGSSNPELTKNIVKLLSNDSYGKVNLSKGTDGETTVDFEESVRGCDVYVIQSTCPPVNDHTMELLIMLDALKRSSPSRITAVIPYLGYARQDRKHGPREPITAKLIADLISVAGPSRVLFLDLHAIQIQGFFDIPADDLRPDNLIVNYLTEMNLTGENVTIVAESPGGARRARRVAKIVKAKIALVENRPQHGKGKKKVMNIVGDIEENCLIIDDMIDTGSKLCMAAEELKKNGCKRVYAWATHAVFSTGVQKLQDSQLDEIIVTDSIPLPEEKKFPKLKIISVAPMLAEAIRRIHNEESMADMSQNGN